MGTFCGPSMVLSDPALVHAVKMLAQTRHWPPKQKSSHQNQQHVMC